MQPDPLFAGVEIGGTKTIVLLARGRDILRELSIPTAGPAATLEQASVLLRQWHDECGFAALGIASFGPLDLDRSSLGHGHMLPTPKAGWSGADILGTLTNGLDCPAAIDTDVNGAALAEYMWGAGARKDGPPDSLCYITIGTGIGGGFVINGRPLHGAMHPEIGHIRVRRASGDDFPGVCPFHGDCIEGLVSGPALAARFGRSGTEIPADDPRWAHVCDEIAQLLGSLLLMAAPRLILIGGGVGMGRAGLLQPIRERLVKRLAGYLAYVNEETVHDIVRPPVLGEKAGPLGAVALAKTVCASAPPGQS